MNKVYLFSTSWCKPCKKVSVYLEDLKNEFKEQFSFERVDCDEEENWIKMDEFKVKKIPFWIIIPKDGKIHTRIQTSERTLIEKELRIILNQNEPQLKEAN